MLGPAGRGEPRLEAHLVLTGRAGEHVLDSYGPERAEHVRHFIDASMALGGVICVTDPDAAARRDAAMRADLAAGVETPPRPLPRLGPGLHRGDAGGLAAIQAPVLGATGAGLFDDVTAGGGTLLCGDPGLLDGLPAAQLDALAAVGVQCIALGGDVAGGRQAADITGDYGRWLADLGAVAVLIRPDFYVYAAARAADEIPALVHRFLDDLTAGPAQQGAER